MKATEDKSLELRTSMNFDNNTLVISQARNIVVLPYTLKELQNILDSGESECGNLCELIEQKYTLPLSRYKHACISRFKEAFTLVREREKGSVMDALDLATELFFNRFLHPAVITACKNLDWLDIYLDCLERNELEEFSIFKIRYEMNFNKAER